MRFTEEQLIIRDMAKSFAQEQIKPNASDRDRDGTFPKDTMT
ncbi:acyl-CoA dehydrogenase family protein, partial [Acinetobacter baumannii]